MLTELIEVTCPTCCQFFGVAVPPTEEVPSTVDYDCEVCCSPMLIQFYATSNEDGVGMDIIAEAHSLGE